jgi:very-short-patch-repair endonuclease
VLSHETAARLLGIELAQDSGVERITVARHRSRVRLEGWDVRRADVAPADVLDRPDGLVVTRPARTVADLCVVLPLAQAVAAADSALRSRLVLAAELVARLQGGPAPGSRRRRRVAALLDARSESVLESLLRVLLAEAGLPTPCTQVPLRADGVLVARVDFCWPASRLVVEADGFAFHRDRVAYRRDRERLNQLESLGWRVLRFSWEDVIGRPDYVVALVRGCLEGLAA